MRKLFKKNKQPTYDYDVAMRLGNMIMKCIEDLNDIEGIKLVQTKSGFEIITTSTVDTRNAQYYALELKTESGKILRNIISRLQRGGIITYANQNNLCCELKVYINDINNYRKYNKYGDEIYSKTKRVYELTMNDLLLVDTTKKEIKFNDFERFVSEKEIIIEPKEEDGYIMVNDSKNKPGIIPGFFIEIGEAYEYDFQGFIPKECSANELFAFIHDAKIMDANVDAVKEFLMTKVDELTRHNLELTEHELTELLEKAGFTEFAVLSETAIRN